MIETSKPSMNIGANRSITRYLTNPLGHWERSIFFRYRAGTVKYLCFSLGFQAKLDTSPCPCNRSSGQSMLYFLLFCGFCSIYTKSILLSLIKRLIIIDFRKAYSKLLQLNFECIFNVGTFLKIAVQARFTMNSY